MFHLKNMQLRILNILHTVLYALLVGLLSVTSINLNYVLIEFDRNHTDIKELCTGNSDSGHFGHLNVSSKECSLKTILDQWETGTVFKYHNHYFYVYCTLMVYGFILIFSIMSRVQLLRTHYSLTFGEIIHWMMLLSTASYLTICNFPEIPRVFFSHFGAWSLFFTWNDFAIKLGKINSIGRYVFMFTSVLWTLFKVLMFYLAVLSAFTFAFHLLLPHNEGYESIITAFIKSSVMMVGEFEYQGSFSWDASFTDGSFISNQILFVLFVICVSLVLNNLLNALAIKEVGFLYDKADWITHKNTVTECVKMEAIHASKSFMKILMYLPYIDTKALKALKKKFRKLKHGEEFSQTFNSVESVKNSFDDPLDHLKLTVKPFKKKTKIGPLNSSLALVNNPTGTKKHQVYFTTDQRLKAGFKLPNHIVNKTLKLLKDRQIKRSQPKVIETPGESRMVKDLLQRLGRLPKKQYSNL